ncbi:MAG: hypothetical protein AAFP18_02480 [Bacteroidota bacterium]
MPNSLAPVLLRCHALPRNVGGAGHAQVAPYGLEHERIVMHEDNAEPVPLPEETVNRGTF